LDIRSVFGTRKLNHTRESGGRTFMLMLWHLVG
jgi:hypothetical protein